MTQTANGAFGELWLHLNATPDLLEKILHDLQHHDIATEVVQ